MKGQTTLEAIKDLVIAALAILLFVGALTSLIFPFIFSEGSGDEKYANNFLKIVNSQIVSSLEVSEYEETLTSTLPKKFMIIGFGTEDDEVIVPSLMNTYDTIPKPDECGGNACLCLYDVRDLSSCKVFEQEIIFLGTDSLACNSGERLTDFEYPASSENLRSSALQPFNFTKLVLGTGYYQSSIEGTHRGCENSELYIEKKTFQDKEYVLITESLIGKIRDKYLGTCSQASEEFCKGKQEFTINQTEYCDFDTFTGKCELKELTDCEGEITEPCLCDNTIKELGVCKENKHYSLNCDQVTECASYFRFLTSNICPEDPCSVSEVGCEFGSADSGITTSCIEKGSSQSYI